MKETMRYVRVIARMAAPGRASEAMVLTSGDAAVVNNRIPGLASGWSGNLASQPFDASPVVALSCDGIQGMAGSRPAIRPSLLGRVPANGEEPFTSDPGKLSQRLSKGKKCK